ncbi:MAG: efflux RND transporter permease subunit [Pseudanabaena sp. M090S1SP1A06QC]|jgi:multidrug efflux pump subunit AcrB|nr:efflux RND transporter permease subunit [Pseudanabaena sp. M051S1SP1A06QC]MCA6588882.1 efflux RND transporter permease subunit [Pseudanabaena sp. M109S1SP1A06QC]MCA6604387.1 efflux RND transporter permease subunit [Pseudanabaena sp. M007S1SP1A06QC]MCA6616221.1 efflux RND transporter permease subunit [Pseudanabaena sp. M090S1SP1A06QC]MCA6621336.1 efflux RND transporter permease subunit [Pseudanabaena sp. M165S2SP1A06QC]MCE2977306.1 efflux RND transporter permease subunit [Pseudanabaena sp. C
MSEQKSSNPKPAGFSISAIAIRRHIGTLMLTLAIFVMGAFYISRLQVDLLPSIVYPRIGVQINIPGISPEVAITEVTKPLEEALALTEGVNQLFSRTREGQVRVDLFFDAGSNVEQALNNTVASFNRGRSQLPDNIEDARIFKFDPSQFPIYEFALTSPSLSLTELRLFADEELGRELAIVPGVAGIDVVGGVKEEIQVNLDLKRLQAVGVSIDDVLKALRDRNVDISGGRLRNGTVEPLTRAIGRFRNAKELESLSFTVPSGSATIQRQVYLRDFAEIVDGKEEQRIFTSLNSQAAVRLLVTKQPDANTIEVVDRVTEKIAALQVSGAIPSDAIITATLDESKLIRASVANVTSSGILGAILAGTAVLLFLGSIRQTLIITLAIPLATLASIIAMGIFGFSMNLFSLGGLALGVGGVVDCSIVMLDNIINGLERNRKNHGLQDIIAQAQISSSEIESALVASTSTNLVVIFPFLLLGGFLSLLFNQLILTISFGNIAAIVIAITVVPMIASRLLGIPWSSRLGETWFMRGFQQRFAAATLGYAGFLSRVVHYRLWVVIAVFAILGGGGFLMGRQLPQEIIPQVKTGDVSLNAQFPAGTTLATNRKVMEIVDNILVNQPETAYAFTTIGGNFFGNNVNANPLRSGSTITLKANADLAGFISRVNREISKLNLAGVRIRVNPGQVRGIIVNNSPIPRTDIDVILQGSNPETLAQAGAEILSALEKNVKGANFRPDTDARQPEVQIFPDWERLQALRLTTQSVGSTLQTAITGSVPTQLQRGDRLVNVRVQLDPKSRKNASQIQQVPLFVSNNRPVRLADVSNIREGRAPGEIQRINQRQVFLILGSLERGTSLSDALKQTEDVIASINLPDGVVVLPSTAKQANDNLSKAFGVLGLLASFLVFVVMAVQYNSLIDPLVIMLTIPLALAGGIVGLYVTNSSINVMVVIGVILLVGIVVNNAIVMVEFANQLREEQKCSRIQAILQAAPIRLRPILMTTITTVVGAFPLALGGGEGGEFLQPLGIVAFSGLALATILTLFLIPCSYVLLHEFSWTKVKKLVSSST